MIAQPSLKALRAQALTALRELLRGFEAADRAAGGDLLRGHESDLCPGLVSAILRIVFVLLAEGRGLLPASIAPLHADLRAGAHGGDAWARVLAIFRLLPSLGAKLFDLDAYPFLEGRVPDAAVLRVLDLLLVVDGERVDYRDLDVEHLGGVYEELMGWEVEAGAGGALALQPSEERRRHGAHYTSRAMTALVVERALAPLLGDAPTPDAILALRVCDPAMGSGAFLLEACRRLAGALAGAWDRAGAPGLAADPILHARRLVARRCLYGVDRNPLAVDLARLSLALLTLARDEPLSFADHALRHGDALVGLGREQIASGAVEVGSTSTSALEVASFAGPEAQRRARTAGDLVLATFFGASGRRARALAMAGVPDLVARVLEGPGDPEAEALAASCRARYAPFHWEIELPEVFSEDRGGFDAIVGNPPWVSYAGRAAQPLAAELRDLYAATSPAFAGYKNLQGVFVHRAATLLRPGGRLGLVLPTSMSDLGGYEPSRRAHDALAACDADLPDFGDRAFDGVFQPSMALLSTRRPAPVALAAAGPWPLRREDLDEATAAFLARLAALPRLPPHLFGERGFQSMGDDVKHLHDLPGPEGAFTTGVRVGGDVEPFLRRPPQRWCDPQVFGGRFRPAAAFREVKLLLRQTARYPMAALSDGGAFRNSILAGFSDEAHGEHLLLAYLNSAPVRFYHYMRHRDARQGMPQLKIAHLRALPAPPRDGAAREALEAMGRELGERNAGVTAEEQGRIDGLVGDLLDLDAEMRGRIARWAASVRG